MKKLVMLAIFLGASAVAQAGDEIDVTGNADALAMQQDLRQIGMTIFPCLMQASSQGKSDQEAEDYCFCENYALVEARVENLKKLRSKHPEWEGKQLMIVTGTPDDNETFIFGDKEIEANEMQLKRVSENCK